MQPNQAQAQAPGAHQPKPSQLILWAVHICNLVIIIFMTMWPLSSGSIANDLNTYCHQTYFSGYNSPDCSASQMTACYKDSKCALWHEFFDRDRNFFCSSGMDCEECKCTEANVGSSLIALWVFTGIGFAIEFARLIIVCQFTSNTSFAPDSGELAAISDSIVLRWVQIVNPSFYSNEIMDAYNMRYFFGFRTNALLWVYYILHHVPCYVCAFVIYGMDSSNTRFNMYLFGALVLETVQIMIKMRYRNGEPYKSAQTQINALPTQGQVMGAPVVMQQPVQYVQQPQVITQEQGQMIRLPDGRIARVIAPMHIAQQQGVTQQIPAQVQASAPYAVPQPIVHNVDVYSNASAPPAYANEVANNQNNAQVGEGGTTGDNPWG